MIDIFKDSICLECEYCKIARVVTDEGAVTYADCTANLYAFPVQKGKTCPYFVKGEENNAEN